MKQKTNPVSNGHAAGKSGLELGLEYEDTILECIKTQGWIREREAAILTSLNEHYIGVVARRLLKKGEILRDRPHGNAGNFLRLSKTGAARVGGKSGEKIKIPESWRHHALAIQTLNYLSKLLDCGFETEASMRRRLKEGKFPDGKLVSAIAKYFFEQELGRKTGKDLRKQVEVMVSLIKQGYICHVAYPYPPKFCGGFNHEMSQINAFRREMTDGDMENLKLVRCHFSSHVAFLSARPSHFEVISLPSRNGVDAQRPPAEATTELRFHWEMREIQGADMPKHIKAILWYNGANWFDGTFGEALDHDEPHSFESDYFGFETRLSTEGQSFEEFIRFQQHAVEKNVRGEIEMFSNRIIE